uniref:Invertebrate defensins family profile domain-containing protein n=1 Tax=Tetranychus urticae TaxID=32264 RepID=T1K426_TETUR
MGRISLLCFAVCFVLFIGVVWSTPVADEEALDVPSDSTAVVSEHVRMKRWVCNNWTGDFLCAGWPGAWRCHCGANCVRGACTCKHC